MVFAGVVAVSSGGSPRLLLDCLFQPNYGAARQILKAEIGADVDATCGAEPSRDRERAR